MTLQAKWRVWPDWDGWHIANGDGENFIVESASYFTMARIVAALNFCEGISLERLESAERPAKELLDNCYLLLDNYMQEIDYQIVEGNHDADALDLWLGDQDRVVAQLKELEKLTDYLWYVREGGDENAE